MRTGALIVLSFLLAGCDNDATSIVVELRTDLIPAREFHAVAVVVAPTGEDINGRSPLAITSVFSTSPTLEGLRVGETGTLEPGIYQVLVQLLDADMETVVERPLLVELRAAPVAVTAVITRDCVGVRCDATGASACHGGSCADATCAPETPASCPSECEAGVDCPALGACALPTCVDGICFYSALEDRCMPTERCDLELGCVSLPTDAGAPFDAGPPPGPTDLGAAGTTTFTVPEGCTRLALRLWGAGGGPSCAPTEPGAGGFSQALVDVTPLEELTVVVGGAGGVGAMGSPGAGGDPGAGGVGGTAARCGGGGGGGFSGVFRGAVTQANALAVAGGGGGSGALSGTRAAGAGGGLSGQDGPIPNSGGTQTMGGLGSTGGTGGDPGAELQGGDARMGATDGAGGGGGGYFGGGASNNAGANAEGAGGGSGFVTGALAATLAGDRQTPANVDDPDRGGAGDPGADGRVILECLR